MKTIKISKTALNEAIKVINAGGVVVCPSDTVYGLIADATNKKAVEKIFKIKKRPKTKPLGVFVKDIEMVKKLAFIDIKQEKFLRKNTPGKITVILKKRPACGLSNSVGNKTTIGIRIIKNKFINELLQKIKKSLAQTSANISGQPATTKIGEVLKQFKNCGTSEVPQTENMRICPELVVDAGDLPKSRPSKVVDLTGAKPLTTIR